MRPDRIYKKDDEYFFLVGGKKRKIRKPKKMSDKKLITININTYNKDEGRKIKKRRKRRKMKYSKKIIDNMIPLERKTTGVVHQQQLPVYLFEPEKKIDSIFEKQKEAKELKQELRDLKLLTNIKTKVEDPERKDATVKKIEEDVKPIIEMFLLNTTNFRKQNYDEFRSFVFKENISNIIDYVEDLKTNKIVAKLFIKMRNEWQKRNKNEDITLKMIEAGFTGSGSGNNESHALWNDEIEKIVKKKIKDDFVPVIARDKTEELLKYVKEGMPDFSFVINTAPSTSDGSTDGHWRSVYINNNDDYQSAEYFDPLVSTPEPSLVNIMRKICKIINPQKMFKFKNNALKTQANTTDTCGYHAVRFLELRNNNVPFSEATGYDAYIEKNKPDFSVEGEGAVAPYVSKYNSFI